MQEHLVASDPDDGLSCLVHVCGQVAGVEVMVQGGIGLQVELVEGAEVLPCQPRSGLGQDLLQHPGDLLVGVTLVVQQDTAVAAVLHREEVIAGQAKLE